MAVRSRQNQAPSIYRRRSVRTWRMEAMETNYVPSEGRGDLSTATVSLGHLF
jgi:hypothetical protein